MRILVATDLSELADEAIRQAHAWSKDDVDLAVCHVVPNLQPISILFPQRTQETIVDLATLQTRAEDAVRKRVCDLTGRAPSSFEVFVEQGVDYAAVAQRAAAWKADLLVVGTHGFTGLKRILLGSVAERIARYAPCPVLVARPGPQGGPVLAATDLSDPSLPALTAGQHEAERRAVPLRVIHAVDLLMYSLPGAALPMGMVPMTYTPEVVESLTAAVRVTLAGAMQSAHATGDAEVVFGDATSIVVREAERCQAQLVVVGTHGRTGLPQVTLGSVAEKIVRTAPCSVLVVRLAKSF